ncbi:hypothetical protein P9112_001930 [Eukaryota sp. TZLM1-RC]
MQPEPYTTNVAPRAQLDRLVFRPVLLPDNITEVSNKPSKLRKNIAALKIQRAFRDFRIRKHLSNSQHALVTIDSIINDFLVLEFLPDLIIQLIEFDNDSTPSSNVTSRPTTPPQESEQHFETSHLSEPETYESSTPPDNTSSSINKAFEELIASDELLGHLYSVSTTVVEIGFDLIESLTREIVSDLYSTVLT